MNRPFAAMEEQRRKRDEVIQQLLAALRNIREIAVEHEGADWEGIYQYAKRALNEVDREP